jgi:hypothetical protein
MTKSKAMTKIYNSFNEIDQDLEILKLQREIHQRKMNFQWQQSHELITPQSIITSYIKDFSNTFTSNYIQILHTLVPVIIKWMWHKKRG